MCFIQFKQHGFNAEPTSWQQLNSAQLVMMHSNCSLPVSFVCCKVMKLWLRALAETQMSWWILTEGKWEVDSPGLLPREWDRGLRTVVTTAPWLKHWLPSRYWGGFQRNSFEQMNTFYQEKNTSVFPAQLAFRGKESVLSVVYSKVNKTSFFKHMLVLAPPGHRAFPGHLFLKPHGW